jgi:hypothetical protein
MDVGFLPMEPRWLHPRSPLKNHKHQGYPPNIHRWNHGIYNSLVRGVAIVQLVVLEASSAARSHSSKCMDLHMKNAEADRSRAGMAQKAKQLLAKG